MPVDSVPGAAISWALDQPAVTSHNAAAQTAKRAPFGLRALAAAPLQYAFFNLQCAWKSCGISVRLHQQRNFAAVDFDEWRVGQLRGRMWA
jgi:hypothetical protein